MTDPATTLNARLMQAHGLAYTLSDMSGDAMCPDAIRTAFYGLAELISQAQEAFEQLESQPEAEYPAGTKQRGEQHG